MAKRHGQKAPAHRVWLLGWKGSISLAEFGRRLGDTGRLWFRYQEAQLIDRQCRSYLNAPGSLIAFCREHDGEAFLKHEAEALRRLERDGEISGAKLPLAAAHQVQRDIRLAYLALARELGDRATVVLEHGICRFIGTRGSIVDDEVPKRLASELQFDWTEKRIFLPARPQTPALTWERVTVTYTAGETLESCVIAGEPGDLEKVNAGPLPARSRRNPKAPQGEVDRWYRGHVSRGKKARHSPNVHQDEGEARKHFGSRYDRDKLRNARTRLAPRDWSSTAKRRKSP